MNNNATFQINIAGNAFANIEKLQSDFTQLVTVVGDVDKSINTTFNNLQSRIKTINFSTVIGQVQHVIQAFAGISAPGIGFGQEMADLSSITDIVGKDLVQLGKIARQTGRESGLGASEVAKAFATIAGQIEVDDIGMDGLLELQRNSITLAHASGLALGDAADALAGTINQFEYGADQADRVINVLAAGSKVGAAEIEHLTQSFKIVGSQASIAGVSIEETTGALEVLSKNNVKGSEAGTHLRNIILSLQTVFGADLKNMTLSEALDQLKPKLNDAAFMSQNFGRSSKAAAQFLVKNSDAIKDLTDKVTGTTTAHEQAATRTETVQQMMARCRATVDDLKIGFFNITGSIGGYMTLLSEQIVTFTQLLPLFSLIGKGLGIITSAQKINALWTGIVSTATGVWTGVQWLLNAALWANPITWVVAAILALIAVIVICVTKVEGWGRQWDSVVKFMKLSGQVFVESFKHSFNTMINGIMIGLDYVKLGWYKFKEAIGLGDSDSNQQMIAQISGDIDRRKQEIVDGAENIRQLSQQAKDALTWELGWKKDEDKADEPEKSTKIPGADIIPMLGLGGSESDPAALDLSGKGGKGSSGGKSASSVTKSEPLDLNKIVPDLKGSTAYSAIAAKLAPVVISESRQQAATVKPEPAPAQSPVVQLAEVKEKNNPFQKAIQSAAAIALPLAIPATMAATTLPQDKPLSPNYAHTEYVSQDDKKTVSMSKFCDKIEIHIANPDGKGHEQIRKEIVTLIEQIFDDYA